MCIKALTMLTSIDLAPQNLNLCENGCFCSSTRRSVLIGAVFEIPHLSQTCITPRTTSEDGVQRNGSLLHSVPKERLLLAVIQTPYRVRAPLQGDFTFITFFCKGDPNTK
eukprot:m.902496 g.902496  ORF g.902496 m.902496 type:complete len:110 (+) comp23689_c3_seq69:891-1220(+)